MERLFNSNFNSNPRNIARAMNGIDRDGDLGVQTHFTFEMAIVAAGNSPGNELFHRAMYKAFVSYTNWLQQQNGEVDDAWDYSLDHMHRLGWFAFHCGETIRFAAGNASAA